MGQSIHALQTNSANRKVWLFYWISYVVCSWILFHFEWAIYVPFAILDLVFMRLYYEVQLLFMIFWVCPRFFGVKMVFDQVFSDQGAELLKQHVGKFKALAKEHGEKAYAKGMAKYEEMNAGKPAPATATPAQRKKSRWGSEIVARRWNGAPSFMHADRMP